MEKQVELLIEENEKLRGQIEELNSLEMEKTIKGLVSENKSLKNKNNYLKGSITREVNQRLQHERIDLENKERELNNLRDDLEKKQKIINNFDIDELNTKIEELQNLNDAIIHSLPNSFDEIKEQIIKELTEEFERFSEKDNNTDRTCGYLIGINKAKKIIREKLKVSKEHLKEINDKEINSYIYFRKHIMENNNNINIINNIDNI